MILRHFCRTQHLSIHDRTLSHPKHENLTRSVYTGALVHSLQGSQHCWVIQYGKAKGVTPFMRPSSERIETPRLCGTAKALFPHLRGFDARPSVAPRPDQRRRFASKLDDSRWAGRNRPGKSCHPKVFPGRPNSCPKKCVASCDMCLSTKSYDLPSPET